MYPQLCLHGDLQKERRGGTRSRELCRAGSRVQGNEDTGIEELLQENSTALVGDAAAGRGSRSGRAETARAITTERPPSLS